MPARGRRRQTTQDPPRDRRAACETCDASGGQPVRPYRLEDFGPPASSGGRQDEVGADDVRDVALPGRIARRDDERPIALGKAEPPPTAASRAVTSSSTCPFASAPSRTRAHPSSDPLFARITLARIRCASASARSSGSASSHTATSAIVRGGATAGGGASTLCDSVSAKERARASAKSARSARSERKVESSSTSVRLSRAARTEADRGRPVRSESSPTTPRCARGRERASRPRRRPRVVLRRRRRAHRDRRPRGRATRHCGSRATAYLPPRMRAGRNRAPRTAQRFRALRSQRTRRESRAHMGASTTAGSPPCPAAGLLRSSGRPRAPSLSAARRCRPQRWGDRI